MTTAQKWSQFLQPERGSTRCARKAQDSCRLDASFRELMPQRCWLSKSNEVNLLRGQFESAGWRWPSAWSVERAPCDVIERPGEPLPTDNEDAQEPVGPESFQDSYS